MKKIIVFALTLVLSATISQAQTPKKTNTVNNLKTNKMTAKEVVEAYSIALSKGDVPTAFSYFSPNGTNQETINFQERKQDLMPSAKCLAI